MDGQLLATTKLPLNAKPNTEKGAVEGLEHYSFFLTLWTPFLSRGSYSVSQQHDRATSQIPYFVNSVIIDIVYKIMTAPRLYLHYAVSEWTAMVLHEAK